MKAIKYLFLLAILAITAPTYGQGLKAFKLKNGLSVYIWEDSEQSDVYGMVGVRAGSVNDPEQYTGLAHYLEHLLFKGTEKIGTLDWQKEEPIYKQIIAKYDEMAEATDPAKKEAINKEINELTIQQAQHSVSNEFSNLMESMGGKDVNAGTIYDYTVYYNSFPAYQINKWLEISSQRLLNPVFRTFQTELETVYEEYNRFVDNQYRAVSNFVLSKAFEGHPYSRAVLGLPEHLKNPRISELIKFYEDWYVPENMVLILVGNVKAQEVSGRINASFGRLAAKPTPERKTYPDLEIKGRVQHSAKIGMSPSVNLIFKGIPKGHPDERALEIAMSLLSNSSRTGTLDKLVIDGELLSAYGYPLSLREQGRCLVSATPFYDRNQRRYESNRATERKLLKSMEKIVNGDFEQWTVDAIKIEMCRLFDLGMESESQKANILFDAFVNEVDLGTALGYKEEVMAVTIEDIKRVAKEYLTGNFLAIHTEKGKDHKKEKLEKPGFKAVESPQGQQSLYAQQFKNMPIGKVSENFMNFDEVQTKPINEKSKFFYTQNKENEVFSLILRYGVGTRELPQLGIAANLMNNAGIMGAFTPQELKEEFSKLHVTSRVSASDDYLTISMSGYETNLAEACQLLSRQILMPQLDEKQLNNSIGSILSSRSVRKEDPSSLANALREYIRYQNKSDFIDEITDKEIIELQISKLTGDINRASNYEAEIHYTGTLPLDDVYQILSLNLPLVANERPSNSPQVKPFVEVTENTVYFLPNSDVEQAQIMFFMPTSEYKKEDDVLRDAFYQYFSGSFNGLVLTELREKRSMVYTAGGSIATPALLGHPTCFLGSIGTQNDKAIEALTIYMDLLRNMPENADRIDNIKSYMRQEVLTTHPSFRYKSQVYQSLRRMGYDQDPAIENLPKIDALTFEDIVKFYKETVKDKPIVIAIMGNPKNIKVEDLNKFGKVVRLNERRLFNTKDTMF
ncbi:insulinase family protein [Bacteroides sp. 214]|uniref:M16 family metallopeptidase n=1 Tax=Bacteroides sp. 214 TaxID=2302935 RepID=UPI0013D439E6|nr:M16 family metallopeptidase [Bacteroides sp. 214]NDW13487.1 insulinase family protein [Bacteroides sp. 214]